MQQLDNVLAFVGQREPPALEIRVNFGLFASREATPAEIDELAVPLRELVPAFAIVAEDRHEFADSAEAAVHQVVIEVPCEIGRASCRERV